LDFDLTLLPGSVEELDTGIGEPGIADAKDNA
jgi:hypothetical protein